MTGSYLARHRPICAVIEDIRQLAQARGDILTEKLCDEATQYAQSMSKKLVEYKEKQNDDQ